VPHKKQRTPERNDPRRERDLRYPQVKPTGEEEDPYGITENNPGTLLLRWEKT
jgi:hypothetical protein